MTDINLIEQLKAYFVSKKGDNVVQGSLFPSADNTYVLGSSSKKWDTLYVRNLVADTVTQSGGGGNAANADTVDGFHAFDVPTPRALFTLNENGFFHRDVYPEALLMDGSRPLENNLPLGPLAKIGGVDVPLLNHDFYEHDGQTAIEAHQGSLGVAVRAGRGLLNALDNPDDNDPAKRTEPTLDPEGGLLTKAEVWLHMQTPGTLDVATENDVEDHPNHIHKILSSANPGDSRSLLATDLYGGLKLDTDLLVVDAQNDRIGVKKASPARTLDVTGTFGATGDAWFGGSISAWDNSSVVAHFYKLMVEDTGKIEHLNADMIDGKHRLDLYHSETFLEGSRGWRLLDDGTAEFENAIIRGRIESAVFSSKTVSAISGEMLLAPGATLLVDVAPTDTTLIADYPSFRAGDIVQLKSSTARTYYDELGHVINTEGSRTEWMRVAGTYSIAKVTDSQGKSVDGYFYPVTRNLNELAAPCQFNAGDAIVGRGFSTYSRPGQPLAAGTEQGAFGQYMPGGANSETQGGWLLLDGTRPFLAVEARKGPRYDQYDRVVTLGNLQNCQISGYDKETYGMVIGDANNYLAYDQALGMRLHTVGDSTPETTISSDGFSSQVINIPLSAASPAFADDTAKLFMLKDTNGPQLWVRMRDSGEGADGRQQEFQLRTGSDSVLVTSGHFYIDGPLAVLANASGKYIAPAAGTLASVTIALDGTGTAGSTIIDINKNGTTIFTSQDSRPAIAFNDMDKKATANPTVVDFAEGDVFTIDIDQVATGASCLSVMLNFDGSFIGVNDHGSLSGLGDNDHPQYMLKSAYDTNGDGKVNSAVNADVAASANNAAALSGIAVDCFVRGQDGRKSTVITDFNADLPCGFYYGWDPNGRPGAGGWLLTVGRIPEATQYQTQIAQNIQYPAEIYHRICNGGSWSAWGKMWTGLNLDPSNPPVLPHMEAYRSVSASFGSGAWSTMPWNNISQMNGSFGWSSDGYAVPQTGVYAFSVSLSGSLCSILHYVGFQVNGQWKAVFKHPASGNPWSTSTGICYAAAGQVIKPFIRHDSGGTYAVDYQAEYSPYFRLARIA